MVEITTVVPELIDELAEIQNDLAIKSLYGFKGYLFWLAEVLSGKYLPMAQDLLQPFPTSYLVKCAFSTVTDILSKKRNSMDIVRRGYHTVKLSKLSPNFKDLCEYHEVQGSH